MRSTRVSRHLRAPRERVYAALLDPARVADWKVPAGMSCEVHTFQPVQGGSIRVSLTYDAYDSRDEHDAPGGQAGKTTAQTDTYHGRFTELIPTERIVEVDEFETGDPALQGAMTITVTLSDEADGTLLVAVHDDLPPGVSLEDNETGWNESLDRLARLVERQ